MKIILLEDAIVRAEFDPSTGAIVALVNKASGWRIHGRKALGLSFRMMAPLEQKRNNPIDGLKQRPPKAAMEGPGTGDKGPGRTKKRVSAHKVTFTWSGLASEFGGELDITFRSTVSLKDGVLLFEGEVQNRSACPLESVSYPCLGDVSQPSPQEKLQRMSGGYAGMDAGGLLPKFDGDGGYFGFDCPWQRLTYPSTPFVLQASADQGLYCGVHDASAAQALNFAWELKPGFAVAHSEAAGLISPTGKIDGKPNHLEFCVWHFPFAAPGETRKLPAIALAPYSGSWHKGVDLYKAWRRGCFTPPPAPPWSREVHSWQQIHINSPEDELRCRYTDLVQYGEDCARHGVKAIQLVGWNDGGQDRGNPSHDTDPRLGTAAELKEAIAKIRQMGVEVILFAKFTWADRSQEWFRKEGIRYASKDPYGDYHVYGGYRYQTPTQLADINTRRLVPMCHSCAAWREVANRELAKTMDLGAGGVLYDEAQHHGGAVYCFDSSHGHRVPAHSYAGDAPLAEGFLKLAADRGLADRWLLAGEACYDLQYRHYSIAYTRIGLAGAKHTPVQRYIDPQAGYMIAVTGFNDRYNLNQCLLYRYIISYEPFNFKGRLDDFPRTIRYGKRIDALRRRYASLLWHGDFRDTQGARVTAGGRPLEHTDSCAGGAWTVFADRASGKRAVVVANFWEDRPLTVDVKLEGATKKTRLILATPESPSARPTKGRITLPPASASVVMEG